MRSTYNKSQHSGPPNELNTRPPGYRALEDRIVELETLVENQDRRITALAGMVEALKAGAA